MLNEVRAINKVAYEQVEKELAKEMADHIWRDVLMEAEAAIEAYPDPVEIEA